jgi:broad specificity phosphatase PhoE
LTLVRHGQSGSFGTERALTPLGEAQAARLACGWLKHGVRFDEVYSGTLARQVRTEEIVAETFRDAGEPWPEAQRDGAWNEYDAGGALVCAEPQVAELKTAAEAARGGPDKNRMFHRLLVAAMGLWMDGAIAGDHIEPWPAFRDRVSGALARLMAGRPNRRVAVFTSGGVIGFAVHRAMQSPERVFLDVNWRVRNASLSEFLFDRERLTLDAFNRIGHLEDEKLWSYR